MCTFLNPSIKYPTGRNTPRSQLKTLQIGPGVNIPGDRMKLHKDKLIENVHEGTVLATTPRTTWSLRCALPTRTWSPPPSARFPSTSALRTLSGFPLLAARVRVFLFKSVSTSQSFSLVPPVKVNSAVCHFAFCPCFFAFTFSSYLLGKPPKHSVHLNVEAKLIVVWSNFLVWAIICKTCVQLITPPLELFPWTPVLPTPPS